MGLSVRHCLPRAVPYANTEAMNRIARAVSPSAHGVLVLDGAGWHASLDLVIPENITLILLPSYAPELNPVENVWEYLRKNKLANRLYETYEDIVEACCGAWKSLIAAPHRIASITRRTWAKAS